MEGGEIAGGGGREGGDMRVCERDAGGWRGE